MMPRPFGTLSNTCSNGFTSTRPQSQHHGDCDGDREPVSRSSGGLTETRVLVVDDDAQMRLLVASVFIRAGATVKTAECAADARKAIVQFEPHLLVSDIEMPGEDGCALMRRIQHPSLFPCQGRDLPSIALSGSANPETRVNALCAGFRAFMQKPFVAVELVRLAVELISTRGTAPGSSK